MLCGRSLLVICFRYSSVCTSVPKHPSPHPSPPATMSSLSKSASLILFCKFICIISL